MYFGYGFPRTLACHLGRDHEEWVDLKQDYQYLVAITDNAIQLWSSGLHRVRLSVVDCSTQTTGRNVDAHWCSIKSTLAVLTDQGFINIYHVHHSQEPVMNRTSINAREPCKATIYLRYTTRLQTLSSPVCVTGDSKMLMVGCQDGSIQLVTWLGKAKDLLIPTYPCDGMPELALASLTAMDYCDKSKLAVVVLSNGACALLAATTSGVTQVRELEFSHWVCCYGATCARIGAAAQVVAVGKSQGSVSLYKLHAMGCQGSFDGHQAPGPSGDTPVRQLSVEPWGHGLMQTGPVNKIEWSPDGRAIAVGYRHSGLVVWSPSGCRLLCSLRQPPDRVSQCPSVISRSSISAYPSNLNSPRGGQHPGGFDDLGDSASAGAGPGVSGGGMSVWSQGVAPPGTLEGGIAALSWGAGGYTLTAGYTGGAWALDEIFLATSLPHHHRVAHASVPDDPSTASESEVHVLQAHDRLLVVSEAIQGRSGVQGGMRSKVPREPADTSIDGRQPVSAQSHGSDLSVTHVPLPYQYITSNWPVCHVAVNPNGVDLAVAGRTGLALYNRAIDKWRLFGDVSQERRVACTALGWVQNLVLACTPTDVQHGRGLRAVTGKQDTTPHELLAFPKHHLDFSSLLFRFPLAMAPLAMDCCGNHVVLAFEGLDIALFEVQIHGHVRIGHTATASLQLVRDVSILEVGRPLMDVTLIQFKTPQQRPLMSTATSEGGASIAELSSSFGGGVAGGLATGLDCHTPTRCVMHRWGGQLSVLDLERGSEITLGVDIEAFWTTDILVPTNVPATAHLHETASTGTLSNGGALHELDISAGFRDVDQPWWGYGPAGMQLWFSSSFLAPPSGSGLLSSHRHSFSLPQSTSGSLMPLERTSAGPRQLAAAEAAQGQQNQDLELEFDSEVYPIGISLSDAGIVGITQRIMRGSAKTAGHTSGSLPAFYPIPESQPVLPCLLRRLLLRGCVSEAQVLAQKHATGPHFSRSLEWLLFTALEAEVEARRHKGGPLHSPNNLQPDMAVSLLALTAKLLDVFPDLKSELVVAVARKTDISLWPCLFEAAGSPSTLLERLVEKGSLVAAANMLLVVDSMQGGDVAYGQGVRLLQVTLARGQYSLAGELLRFILFPTKNDGEEEDGWGGEGLAGLGDPLGSADVSKGGASAVQGLSAGGGGGDVSGGGGDLRRSTSLASQSGGGAKPISWFGWLFGLSSFQQPTAVQTSQGGAGKPHQSATNTPHGIPHMSQHASAARRLVAEHAWGLLDQGRLLQLLQAAAATTFLPGGLVNLMRHYNKKPNLTSSRSISPRSSVYSNYQRNPLSQHNSLAPTVSGQPATLSTNPSGLAVSGVLGVGELAILVPVDQPPKVVTANDLLAALAPVSQQLPVWEATQAGDEARAVLELVQALDAQVWVLALSLLLGDLPAILAYATMQPEEWRLFTEFIMADKTFMFLHELVDEVNSITQPITHQQQQQQLEGEQQQQEQPEE